MSKYRAIVIEPESGPRMRLKHALTYSGLFACPLFCHDMQEARKEIEAGALSDVIFISDRIDERRVIDFLAFVKESPQVHESALVMLEDASKRSAADLGRKLIDGVDGILYEPYTVEDVTGIAKLAAQVKLAHLHRKEKAAVALVLKDSMRQIDSIAVCQLRGIGVDRELRCLAEMCAPLAKLQTIAPNEYSEMLCATFTDAAPFRGGFEYQPYGGVSRRVQERLNRKGASSTLV